MERNIQGLHEVRHGTLLVAFAAGLSEIRAVRSPQEELGSAPAMAVFRLPSVLSKLYVGSGQAMWVSAITLEGFSSWFRRVSQRLSTLLM